MYHKMEIQLDEEKFKAEGKDVAEYEKYLDDLCAEVGLVRDRGFTGSLMYYNPLQEYGFDSVGAMYLELKRDQFFVDRCKKWLCLKYKTLDQAYHTGFAEDALARALRARAKMI